jgi:Ca2+-binding EF-hand superfamily protein
MSAEDYWRMFAKEPKKGMRYMEFEKGYRHAEPGVDRGKIREAWENGDQNRDKRLSRKEFMRLVEMMGGEGSSGSDDDMSADDYWRKFAKDPKAGMTRKEFKKAYKNADPGVEKHEIGEAWDQGDQNKDKRLSYEEFMTLV